MLELDKLKFVQDHVGKLTQEEIAKHIGCKVNYMLKKYKRYFSLLDYHTVIYDSYNNLILTDGEEGIKQINKLPSIPSVWILFNSGTILRWRNPLWNEKKYLFKNQLEQRYSNYFKKLVKTESQRNRYTYTYKNGDKTIKFYNKTIQEVQKKLNIDTNTLQQYRKLGIIYIPHVKRVFPTVRVNPVNTHTIVKSNLTNRYILHGDNGISLYKTGRTPSIPKHFIKLEDGEYTRWRSPQYNRQHLQHKDVVEDFYVPYLHRVVQKRKRYDYMIRGKHQLLCEQSTIPEIAELLGISTRKVDTMLKNGIIERLNNKS